MTSEWQQGGGAVAAAAAAAAAAVSHDIVQQSTSVLPNLLEVPLHCDPLHLDVHIRFYVSHSDPECSLPDACTKAAITLRLIACLRQK